MSDLPPLARRLSWDRGADGISDLGEDQIAALPAPIVIVGDPGAGKSVLMKTLGDTTGHVLLRAGSFVRNANPQLLVGDATTLVIDGVDEIGANVAGGGVEAVLTKLSELGNPAFILSCRAADWRGATDRARISDDYGRDAVVLVLEPFHVDQARDYLQTRFPSVDADAVLEHLVTYGLRDIYGNPLTLRLIGEIAESEQQLPASRAGLLDAASRLLLSEENARHQDRAHALRDPEELLQAAGAACAAILLGDKLGVFVGPPAKAPVGYAAASGIRTLPMGEAIEDALKTRLFQRGGEGLFVPVHRVIAEFLAARWIAGCAGRGASAARLHALMLQGANVPTSLRGLHAWTAHFSAELAGRCIAADPYGVLRYGDGDSMPLANARALLKALAALSHEDPYFRSEDWSRHPASALMRPELKSEILGLLAVRDRHVALGALLLEALAGSALDADMKAELTALLLDPARSFNQRDAALDAMKAAELIESWADLVRALWQLGDQNSIRLAADELVNDGTEDVPVAEAVAVVLARAQLTLKPMSRAEARQVRSVHFSTRALAKRRPAVLDAWLDEIAAQAQPFMRGAGQSAGLVGDLVRALAIARIGHAPPPSASQCIRWLCWLDGRQGYDQKRRTRLREFFSEQLDLRREVLAELLLKAKDQDAWRAYFRLADSSLGLLPSEDDIVLLLQQWHATEATEGRNDKVWEDLLRIARQRDGLPEKVRAAAIAGAHGDAARLALIEAYAPAMEEEDPEDLEWEAEEEARRSEVFASHRTFLADHLDDIAKGHGGTLDTPARAYFGRFHELNEDGDDGPKRIAALLGEALAGNVLDGFVAAAHRTDLPTAREIATDHAGNGRYYVELPLVVGVIEMLRRGEDIADLPYATLASAWMAWRRDPESNGTDHFGIGEPLQAAALPDEAATEQFFRDSIEPQLEVSAAHVMDLYLLTHTPDFTELAAKLAGEWLLRFPQVPSFALADLLLAILASADYVAASKVVVASRDLICADRDAVDLWLCAEFVLDFEARADVLREAIGDNRELLWGVRRALTRWGNLNLSRLSIAQLGFLVTSFAPLWPYTSRPDGITSGDTNKWDASRFIDACIYQLGAMPEAAATDMLAHLGQTVANGHEESLRHAAKLQLRVRSDHDYRPSDVVLLRAVAMQDDPQSVDDLRAFLGDRIALLSRKLEGSGLDSWVVYWKDDKPHIENYCRNRLIEQISGELPKSVRFRPEEQMPGQTRADISVAKDLLGLPVEIKGQWHKDVWDAPVEQLDARYTHDWRASGRGVYIVLWFGDVPGKNLPAHPAGETMPTSPGELRRMLIDRIPESRRSQIDVYVINVTGSPDGQRNVKVKAKPKAGKTGKANTKAPAPNCAGRSPKSKSGPPPA